ncbi:MAG TPA: pyridoxamine 5'-phosphate oxidase family protein [Jatrophihabitantaceae bacterium]|jgi:nitroimidazol reductase NimA-like FMN-containing flavoprotein (pyridoxamine 5'-phosphate oxidase superfamily)
MARTTITRLSTKASQDIAELYRLLDTVHIGHFAVVDDDGHPVVLPTAVVRDGDRILAHGSTGSRWMRRLATGALTSLAVTSFDALVVARSTFESSMRYRSAVLFGACTPITDADAKRRALDAVVEGLIPGRVAEVRPANAKELAATQVLSLPIAEWSLKVSEGWPDDTDEDCAGTAWAGVLPATTGYGEPLPAPDLNDGIPLPESVRRIYG